MPDDTADSITEAKRQAEVALRPGKTADVPVPAGLRDTTVPEASYKAPQAARKEQHKSDMEKSLEWNEQQKKALDQ